MEEKIYVDKKGYQQMQDEIKKLNEELHEVRMAKSLAVSQTSGGTVDNFDYEEAKRMEELILGRIRNCYDRLNKVEIIARTEDEEIIDIDDIFSLEFEGEDTPEIFKLVGVTDNMMQDGYMEITMNSPLGKAVYKKRVCDDISYEVNGNIFNATIIAKLQKEDVKKLEKTNK